MVKVKEIWEKMRQAEKLADKHEYQKLLSKKVHLINKLDELQSQKRTPVFYKTNSELIKVEEELKKFEAMDQLAMIGITQDAGGLYKMAMTNKDPYLGKLVWIPIGRDKYKAVVMREDGSRVYVRTQQGNSGWFQKHEVELIKDDDATEHGSIETYGKEKETETMPLEKDPVQAQDACDEEPTNAVKDSYEMLKLCGFIMDDENWITMNGTHIKIGEGESKGEAAKKFIKKKGGDPAPAKAGSTGGEEKDPAKTYKEIKEYWKGQEPASKETLKKLRESMPEKSKVKIEGKEYTIGKIGSKNVELISGNTVSHVKPEDLLKHGQVSEKHEKSDFDILRKKFERKNDLESEIYLRKKDKLNTEKHEAALKNLLSKFPELGKIKTYAELQKYAENK